MEDNKSRLQDESVRQKQINDTKAQQGAERDAMRQETAFQKRKAGNALEDAQRELQKNALQNKPEK